jgi:hypothetical protein
MIKRELKKTILTKTTAEALRKQLTFTSPKLKWALTFTEWFFG